ncbi:MAG: phytoene/squalene synthase family protein [Anaerolineae bacterium]|nr:phytoene/squalene synthase family protein [Anaerolineae bacterium]
MALKQQHSTFGSLPLPQELAPDLAADYAACRQIMHGASKNYSFASRVLPLDKLHHVEALYAVMRVGDDRVDVSHAGFESPLAAIEEWRDSYWRAFETGTSHHPVLRAYVNTCHQFDIPPELLQPYFRAMIEDLSVTRFPTFVALLHYMDGSALTVGRVMTHILGTRSGRVEDAYPYADALSVAMQLSNFWRDIWQDWNIGRVYIPQEDLTMFSYSEADLGAQLLDERLIALLEYEFERTERYYQTARQGVPLLASGRWGVMSALEIYRAIMQDIRQAGYDVFSRRAGTTRLQKLKWVVRARWETL